MKPTSLRPGTEVEVNICGRRFPARITGSPAGGRILIKPLVPNNSFLSARTHQIKQILRPAGTEQLTLGGAS